VGNEQIVWMLKGVAGFPWAALAEVAICAVRLEKEVSVPTGA
jgi:hypothetical protein